MYDTGNTYVTFTTSSSSTSTGDVTFYNNNYHYYEDNNTYEPITIYDRKKEEKLNKKLKKLKRELKNLKMEGIEIMFLFQVIMCYGEDRKNPTTAVKQVIAKDGEDAKIKSGLLQQVDADWDADYLTFICNNLGEVKVKARPKEVKRV